MHSAVRHFYEFGPFRLDAERHRLLRGGEPVPLSPKDVETLLVLVRHPGEMLEREALMHAVWADSFVEDANLTVAVSHLRKALGQDGKMVEYIETIPRIGYRFVADVREVREEPAALVVEKRTLSQTIIEEEYVHDRADEVAVVADASHVAPAKPLAAAAARKRNAFGLAGRIALAVALLVACSAAAFKYLRRGEDRAAPATTDVKTIAVLPFQPLGAQEGDDYLGLGLADALITRLGNVRSLVVRPTSSVIQFGGASRDPLDAGRRLGVEAVLEGKFSRDGERLRVNAQLLRVSDGTLLWANTFEEPFTNLFAVEDSISQNIAGALTLRLSDEEQRLLAKHGTDNADAFREYLRGRHALEKRTRDDFRAGIDHFNRAIDLDPAYAGAYAGLAECYLLLGDYGYAAPKETFPSARAAAQRALEIDDSLADAHATLAYVKHLYDWDWAGAEREFKRAVELNPNSASAHHRFGWHLATFGRNDEAMREIRRAEELDPLSLIIKSNIGTFLYFARDYDGAIAQLRKVLDANPDFVQGRRKLAFAYEAKGMEREAVAEWLKVEEQMGMMDAGDLERLRTVCETEGLKGYWRQAVVADERARESEYVSADSMASYYARLGDRDRAFEWLGRAFEERSAHLVWLKIGPVYDNLHGDPRYEEMLRRVGL